jgi:ubiquitin-protein ligase
MEMLINIQLHEHVAPGIVLISAENLQEWLMDIQVLDDNPIYKGQIYRLKFMFSNSYPIGALNRPLLSTRTSHIVLTTLQKHPKLSS